MERVPQYNFGEADIAEDEKCREFFVGDKVKFRVKTDKQTKRTTATQVQLVAMNSNRLTGVVTKDSGGSVGKVMCMVNPGLQTPFAFASVLPPPSTNTPTIAMGNSSGRAVQVGDSVEFDLRKDGFASRLHVLPAGSVQVETTSNVVKGVVVATTKEGGTIAVEGESGSAVIHPGSINEPLSIKSEPYHPENVHPASLLLGRGRNGTLSYWNDDARPDGRMIHLKAGDPVNLVICSHVADPLCRRAVQVTTRAKTSSANANSNANSNAHHSSGGKKIIPSSVGPPAVRRATGGVAFLRTSQIQAIQQGKTFIPGNDTEDETDDSLEENSTPTPEQN